MMCTSCTIKKICSVYAFKKEHEEMISMPVTTCKYKTGDIQASSTPVDASVSLAEQFDEEEYKKFLNKQKGVTEEDSNEIMTCPSCGGRDYADMITVCSKCGTMVCGNCSTSDNGLTYCNKCWEES